MLNRGGEGADDDGHESNKGGSGGSDDGEDQDLKGCRTFHMVPNTAEDFQEQQQPRALAFVRTLAQCYLSSDQLLQYFRLRLWSVRRCMLVCQPQF